MGSSLPTLSEDEFHRRISALSPELLSPATLDALYGHYCELTIWNRLTSLVGCGTRGDLIARHYGEALAGLPLVKATDRTLIDIGSGGGFPGFILAAIRPQLSVYLVEARERKWAFLRTVSRRSGVACTCILGRVGDSLPLGLPGRADIITCRAVRMEAKLFRGLVRQFPEARLLLWKGASPTDPVPGYRINREHGLLDSDRRSIVELQPLISF